MTRRILIAAIAALALTAPAAQAGPPGKWTQVTGIGQDDLNIMRVGLARGEDGVLHVLWVREGAGNSASLLHTAISPNAKFVSEPGTVFTGPDGMNESTDVVQAPDGTLRAFFAATNVFDGSMATATSSDGVVWTPHGAASLSGPPGKPVFVAAGIGAAVRSDGTFFSIWGDSGPNEGGLHVGLDDADPDADLPGGLKADPDIGIDSVSGNVFAAWNSLDDEGVVVMPVAPGGPRVSIPTSAPQTQHRVGITGRIGAPGVFVAYTRGTNPFLADPSLYRADTGTTKRLTRKDGEQIGIAAAPNGRLWVFWKKGGTITATRSNRSATRFGTFATLRAPKKATTIFDLQGEASRGPLDLFALVDPPTGTLSGWHQRILPRLTVSAKRKKGKTVIRVTDAGARVPGAKVKVKGHGTKTTGGKGTAAFTLPPGRYRVTVTKKTYARAKARVRVRG